MGAIRGIDHSPVIAAGPGGGVVAWYRVRSGIRNDVMVQGFAYDEEGFVALGTPTALTASGDEHAAPPYWPAIAHVGDGRYLVLWAEGANPAFYVAARFFEWGTD